MPTRTVVCLGLVLAGLSAPPAAGQKKEDIPALLKKLKSPFSSDITAAANDLAKLGPAAREAVPELAEALKRVNFTADRIAICNALAKIGPASRAAIPAMAEVLKDKARFSDERIALAKTLGQYGPAAKAAVPALAAGLKTGFSADRIAAAQALGQIGPAARDALPALKEAAGFGFQEVKDAAAAAVKKIEGKAGKVGVKDEAKLFSAAGLQKALDEIYDVNFHHDVDLLVETVAAVPADQRDKVKQMSRNERTTFFQTWAADRARAAGLNGLYVLVCKDPAYIQVEVTPKFRAAFDDAARNRLADLLVGEFKAKRFDDGLLKAVTQVRGKLAGSAPK
jgi:hypothetical protein